MCQCAETQPWTPLHETDDPQISFRGKRQHHSPIAHHAPFPRLVDWSGIVEAAALSRRHLSSESSLAAARQLSSASKFDMKPDRPTVHSLFLISTSGGRFRPPMILVPTRGVTLSMTVGGGVPFHASSMGTRPPSFGMEMAILESTDCMGPLHRGRGQEGVGSHSCSIRRSWQGHTPQPCALPTLTSTPQYLRYNQWNTSSGSRDRTPRTLQPGVQPTA